MSNLAREREHHEDRRIGPSRLSTWSERQIVLLWLLWPSLILAICVVAALVSVRVHAGFSEVRLDLTGRNLLGLAVTMIAPSVYLTALWRRIRGRRRSSPTT